MNLFLVLSLLVINTLTANAIDLKPKSLKVPKVLVIGGTGRVGGSAVRSIHERFGSEIELKVAGRSQENWEVFLNRIGRPLDNVDFVCLDISKKLELEKIIPQFDLIIHTAGPFQGIKEPSVLESSLRHGKLYIDVCDDVGLSGTARSREYRDLAEKNGGAAVISTGIWPGGSSLFAQKVIDTVGGKDNVDKVKFTFFTAGSGNAGPTLLAATFLILGEDVLTYVNGKKVYKKSATDLETVDFGKDIGIREVVRLNLIECESCHSSGIENVETFFGTAPVIWNRLFTAMANIIPQKVLRDRNLMDKFALFSLPMVRLVDKLVGSTNGIRVDVKTKTGDTATGLLTHRDLEKSVGDAIAAFAAQMLKGTVPPGVYFPEEVPGKQYREEILSDISADAIVYSIDGQETGHTYSL